MILFLFPITPCGCQNRIDPLFEKNKGLYLVDKYEYEVLFTFLDESFCLVKLELLKKPPTSTPFFYLAIVQEFHQNSKKLRQKLFLD